MRARLARNPLALAFLVLGGSLLWQALQLAMTSLDGGPGPGMLPALLGALMVALALRVILVEDGLASPVGDLRRIGLMVGGLALHALLLEAVGFVLATAALTAVLLAAFNEGWRGALALLGVAGTVGAYWLFHGLLNVQLPPDPWGLWR